MYIRYSSTSTSWRRLGLNRVPRSDLDWQIKRAFLPTCAGTILYTMYGRYTKGELYNYGSWSNLKKREKQLGLITDSNCLELFVGFNVYMHFT